MWCTLCIVHYMYNPIHYVLNYTPCMYKLLPVQHKVTNYVFAGCFT